MEVELHLLFDVVTSSYLSDGRITKEQLLGVINKDVLERVDRFKWNDLKGAPQRIELSSSLPVSPSVQGRSFKTVWAGSSIFLFGGYIFSINYLPSHSRSRRMFCIDARDTQTQSSLPLLELDPMRTDLLQPPSVTVNGKIYVFGPLTYPWEAEVYDIEDKSWSSLAVPFGGTGWRLTHCILWESSNNKKMIVLFVSKPVKDEKNHVGEFLYYDLENKEWDPDVGGTNGMMLDNYLPYRMVIAGDTLYQVQGVDWIMYDLHLKRVVGKVEGLECIKELLGADIDEDGAMKAHTPDDVVYLGGGGGGAGKKFCIFWEKRVKYNESFLRFALVQVEGDGTKSTGTVSSVAEIPLIHRQRFISCHVMPASHQANDRKRKMEQVVEEEKED